MNYRATKTSTGNLSSNLTIESERSITVFGFVVANSHTSAVEVTWTNASGTVLGYLVVPPQDSKLLNIEWIADRGLIFTSIVSNGSLVNITVFHSTGGA